jgi:hypothetical protein
VSPAEDALDWRGRARCRDIDPDVFFPTASRGPVYAAQVADAKQVCAGCPVQAECLDYALAWLPEGVAGGRSQEEREAIRTRREFVPSADAARLEVGLRPDATSHEIAAAGLVLLAAGRSRREVARRCAVTVRTVHRWVATARAEKQQHDGQPRTASRHQTCTPNRATERSANR